jgi:hypothetical protein
LKHLNKLCDRITGFQGTGRSLDLGAAISAFQRDVSTDFILGTSHNTLEQEDFGMGMTLFMQEGGRIWRINKHIPWYSPLMLAIPRNFLIKYSGDKELANWLRYVTVGLFASNISASKPRLLTDMNLIARNRKMKLIDSSGLPRTLHRMMLILAPSSTRLFSQTFPRRRSRCNVSSLTWLRSLAQASRLRLV